MVDDVDPAEMQVVELHRSEKRELALVEERSIHGTDDHQQERVDCLTVEDEEVVPVNTAAERTSVVEGEQARLARDVIGKRLRAGFEGSA